VSDALHELLLTRSRFDKLGAHGISERRFSESREGIEPDKPALFLALAGRPARSLSPPTLSSSRPPRHTLRSPGAHVADVGSLVLGAE
jgi:hypothetical protein